MSQKRGANTGAVEKFQGQQNEKIIEKNLNTDDTLLSLVASSNLKNILNIPLNADLDHKLKDANSATAAQLATMYESWSVLINSDMNMISNSLLIPKIPSDYVMPWLYVVVTTKVLIKLLNNTMDNLDMEIASTGLTLLHEAVRRNDLLIIKTLLSHGIDVNIKDTLDHCTPLHWAVKEDKDESHLKTIKMLLKNGANPLALNCKGELPIQCLTYHGKPVNNTIYKLLSRKMRKANLKKKLKKN